MDGPDDASADLPAGEVRPSTAPRIPHSVLMVLAWCWGIAAALTIIFALLVGYSTPVEMLGLALAAVGAPLSWVFAFVASVLDASGNRQSAVPALVGWSGFVLCASANLAVAARLVASHQNQTGNHRRRADL